MVAYIAEKCLGTTKIVYGDQEIDLTPPWNRMTMIDAVKKYAGVDFKEIATDDAAREVAAKLKVAVPKDATKR